MAANRGYNSLESRSRLRLIEAASDLLGEQGFQAISARRIADRAGLKPQLVHYYFRSMEELVVAVYLRSSDSYVRMHDEALSSAQPLRALWELNSNMPEARRMTEYIALGKVYPALRAEMRRTGENYRILQVATIRRVMTERGIADFWIAPEALAVLMSAVARNFLIEGEVGMTMGHDAMQGLVGRILDTLEPVGGTAGDRCI